MTKFTFLERYNLSGKGFIPFCTNESSGVGVTISSQSGWRMLALTAAEDELLATTPAEELLGLDTDPNLLLRFLKDLNRNIKATGPMFFLGEAPETGCSDVKKLNWQTSGRRSKIWKASNSLRRRELEAFSVDI